MPRVRRIAPDCPESKFKVSDFFFFFFCRFRRLTLHPPAEFVTCTDVAGPDDRVNSSLAYTIAYARNVQYTVQFSSLFPGRLKSEPKFLTLTKPI